MGVSDGFLPYVQADSDEEIAEELRLFYVAVPRAHASHLTYALTRYRFGRLKHCEPSRFLREIDSSYYLQNNLQNNCMSRCFAPPNEVDYVFWYTRPNKLPPNNNRCEAAIKQAAQFDWGREAMLST